MAEVSKRTWRSGPRQVKHVAWGYTRQVDGRRVKHYSESWSREDAEAALAAALLEQNAPPPPPAPPPPKRFREVDEEYLVFKRGQAKRSLHEDEKILRKLRARFGAETPVSAITAQRIAHMPVIGSASPRSRAAP